MQAKEKLDAIYAAYAEPDADFDALAAEQAKYEAILSTSGADTESQMEVAADALRLPPWEAVIGTLSGGEKRRVASGRSSTTPRWFNRAWRSENRASRPRSMKPFPSINSDAPGAKSRRNNVSQVPTRR